MTYSRDYIIEKNFIDFTERFKYTPGIYSVLNFLKRNLGSEKVEDYDKAMKLIKNLDLTIKEFRDMQKMLKLILYI